MTSEDHVATAEVEIAAPAEKVWAALTDPARSPELWFGAEVHTDWALGSPITWSGEWEGRRYQDRGEILAFEPDRLLRLTHFSPLSGEPDLPENHHTLAFTLSGDDATTHVVMTQDNNPSEEAALHSSGMWSQLLQTLKQVVEAS
ncbi:SRPBCC family protein [Microbacterium sp. ASV81]|uniref:SRPBCC domain-containing protein n=1 Tax=Microbacterium capsulatum TaxID=3041921 RepID=A0ABU0XFI0_9MICO|nr:SRPBCC domain-containing protein [Microbacterium sp. ASV81]MDQ4213865.1 SRPBCC domain-containing protein [Microbacterium sp. ASV81]